MKYTFKQFQAQFPDDAACLEAMMKVQWGGTRITGPGCGVVGALFHPMTKRRCYACQECGHHIYPCADTIFHKSSTKLTNWFFAMYLMTSTRHGVAAKELQRQIGCTYKTAWRMAHELRKLMRATDHAGRSGLLFRDRVEVDEMFPMAQHAPSGKNGTAVVPTTVRSGAGRAQHPRWRRSRILKTFRFHRCDPPKHLKRRLAHERRQPKLYRLGAHGI